MKKRRRKPIRRLNNAMKKRTIFACAFIALLFVILIGRLVYFSVFKNNIYKIKKGLPHKMEVLKPA